MELTKEQSEKLWDAAIEWFLPMVGVRQDPMNIFSAPIYKLYNVVQEIRAAHESKLIWICVYCSTVSRSDPKDFPPQMNAYCSVKAATTLISGPPAHYFEKFLPEQIKGAE